MKIKLNINKLSSYFRRASQEYSFEEEIRDITCSSPRSLNSKSPLILKKFLFIFKKYFAILITIVFTFQKKHQMENKNSFLSIILGAIWIPFRRLILLIVSLFDSISTTPYGGAKLIEANRNLFYGSLSLKVKSRDEGIDHRCNVWKKDVLTAIIKILKDEGSPSSINFLEIGAASGIVSLFLAAWCTKFKVSYDITCIEPSLKNVQFLEETAISNKLRIKIIPLALSNTNGWLDFSRDSSRGLVGSAVDGLNFTKTNEVPSINFETLKAYVSNVGICYVDAFLNEVEIISKLLLHFPNIKIYIVEFDHGIPSDVRKNLEDFDYSISYQTRKTYLFTKSN